MTFYQTIVCIVLISPHGNCFLLSIAYAFGHVIPKQPDSEEILRHLHSLGLESCSRGEDICAKLRKLMFDEWRASEKQLYHWHKEKACSCH